MDGQMAIDEHPDYRTERLAGARRDARGHARGLVIVLTPTTNGCEAQCPPGVVASLHRVVDGKAYVNLVVDLDGMTSS